MKGSSKDVVRLQELTQLTQQLRTRKSPTGVAKVKRVRSLLPEHWLRRFDHLATHGKSALAVLSETGACGSCHLKLPPSDAAAIRSAQDQIHFCPYCGCFLCGSLMVDPVVLRKRPSYETRVSARR